MPASAEEEWAYWDGKATELRRNQLETIRNAAAKWAALLTAFLGVFGTVAFAGGLTTVDKLDAGFALVAQILTTAAAIVALAGIYCFSRAGGGLSWSVVPGLSATSLRESRTTGSKDSIRWLTWGKSFSSATAILVLGGSLLVLWAGEGSAPPKPVSVVEVVNGQLYCGTLKDDGETVTIGGAPTGEVQGVITVSVCPTPKND
ncbi:MAG: hypothetical protein QOH26_1275 [Actinomycetota bacterium]|jgi:hypothetical protein|nr:hypothetical protein [Actinomycetota bacterium]